MDIFNIAQNLISEKLGDNVDVDTITDALKGLFSGEDGELDISNIVSNIASNSDLGSMVSSFFGGEGSSVLDSEAISNIFSSEKIEEFSSKLGMDSESASSMLGEVLPNLLSGSEDGESLLSGGLDGALDMAKKFF